MIITLSKSMAQTCELSDSGDNMQKLDQMHTVNEILQLEAKFLFFLPYCVTM
ncbi:hypothetical protein Mapa_001569 [Marchantia paleacea]|nr:hypothetical protein Mapa_001569 [Marchantia paleacea]